jgi:hypothetical protein
MLSAPPRPKTSIITAYAKSLGMMIVFSFLLYLQSNGARWNEFERREERTVSVSRIHTATDLKSKVI